MSPTEIQDMRHDDWWKHCTDLAREWARTDLQRLISVAAGSHRTPEHLIFMATCNCRACACAVVLVELRAELGPVLGIAEALS